MLRSLPALDSITGALLIGTWASSLLYTAEILQAVYYFSNFKNDGWRIKTLVAAAFVIDTVSAVGEYACVYLYTVSHAGDLAYLSKQNWGIPLYTIATTCVAILVQSFLVFRYWRFTNNTISVVLLSVVILVAFGSGLASGLVVLLFPALKDRTKVRVSGTIWIFTQVSADLIIAAALVYEFQKAKSKFLEGRRRIHNTLDHLVLLTIQTGSATAVIAVTAFITFLINNETNICAGIMFPLGRVYVLSMLLNLNIRVSGDGGSSQGTSRTGTSGRDRGPIVFFHDTGTTHTDGLGGVRKIPKRCISTVDRVRMGHSTRSHTAEDPLTEIEMMAIDSSKKQSELLVI